MRLILVTFCLGHTGLDPVYKISGFCIGSHVLMMVSGPDQSNELSVLNVDDGSIS